ncbi:uncharacterized protein LOC144471949 isoform X3 [Augochlora pura]
MSYHRGGQAGAVAVSYSSSPMTPHSPSRRCSSGSSSTGSSTIGSSSTKLKSYRPTGSFYTSSTSSDYRSSYTFEYRRSYYPSSSYYSLPSTGSSIRRNYLSDYSRSRYSPVRSVSSSAYSNTGGSSGSGSGGTATNVIANGTGGGRYGLSTSSSSSSISIAGSSSKERGSGLDSSSSRPLESTWPTTAEIISRYSPFGYVPNIRQTSVTSGGGSSSSSGGSGGGGHHHWKHHATGSSLTELFGGDEREVVERSRDLRPESSLSSSSSSSSTAAGAGGSSAALWSRSKRGGSLASSTVLTSGHVRAESAAACPGEVTIDERGTIRDSNQDESNDDKDNDDDDANEDDVNEDEDVDDDRHNNNGNCRTSSNGKNACSEYGVNNNDPDDNDQDDDSNLNNRHHRQQRAGAHRTADEDGSPTNKAARNRLQAHRDERCGLNGLRNIGNTCFMNSVIQCLSNTRPLLEYLLNEQYLADINVTTSSMKGALIKAFSQVIHELWEVGGDHVVNTTALKSQIQRFAPRFMGYSQQDAQEFLRYLLEGLHEDVNRVTVKPPPIHTDIPDMYTDSQKAVESWKRYLRSEDSMIVDVFVGQLRSSLRCTACDHVSVTLDPFWDLSLPIPARSGTVKLSQCLEHFTREEVLDGDEKPTCSKCQMRRKCTKSFSIHKFPKILVIHLKRFSPMERFRGKLNVTVDFPLTGLDLSAFAAPRVPGCTYNLYGVANHSGTTYSGHYTAYCKHPYSGEWHEYNDSRVSVVSSRSVVTSEAYVLFYEQQPHNSHL